MTLTGLPTLSGHHTKDLSGCEAADRVRIEFLLNELIFHFQFSNISFIIFCANASARSFVLLSV